MHEVIRVLEVRLLLVTSSPPQTPSHSAACQDFTAARGCSFLWIGAAMFNMDKSICLDWQGRVMPPANAILYCFTPSLSVTLWLSKLFSP